MRNSKIEQKKKKFPKKKPYVSWFEICSDVNSFKDFYEGAVNDIINLYLTPYNKDKMLSIKNFENTNVTFDEYLDYLSGNLNFNADYNYMIIVERLDNKDSNDCYYYALKLKY